MPLSYYNFLLTAIIGLDLAVPQNVATDYARLDGAYPDYTRKPARQLTLTGRIAASTDLQLRTARGDLAAALDRDASALDQLLRLRYWREDDAGAVVSAVVQIDAKYQSGLDGNHTNPYMEDVALRFVQYAPYITAATCRRLAWYCRHPWRTPTGSRSGRPDRLWASLGTGASGPVLALAYGPMGRCTPVACLTTWAELQTRTPLRNGTAARGQPWARARRSVAWCMRSSSTPAGSCMRRVILPAWAGLQTHRGSPSGLAAPGRP